MTLVMRATPEEVMRSVKELQAFGRAQGIAEKDLFGPLLALEECGSNIVDHAVGRDSRGTFEVTIGYDGRSLTVELRDSGPEFDPTSLMKEQAREDDTIGGWGLQLVRRAVDELRYRREGAKNVLSLTKIIRSGRDLVNPESVISKHMALEILILPKDSANGIAATTVKLSGSLDTATAPELERRLAPVLASSIQDVVFDLADLNFISSAGLRVFANARKIVKARGGQAAFIRMQPQILEVFAIIESLPGIAVFTSEQEFDEYIAARQHAHD